MCVCMDKEAELAAEYRAILKLDGIATEEELTFAEEIFGNNFAAYDAIINARTFSCNMQDYITCERGHSI